MTGGPVMDPVTDGQAIVAAARRWIGTPFAWGQAVRGAGCDCKGLIAGVARDLGYPAADSFEARYAGYGAQVPVNDLRAGLAQHFTKAAAMQPGDVLLIRVGGRAQHLAIFAGGEDRPRMIHTYSKGPQRVIEVPMGTIWTRAVDSVWRWHGKGSVGPIAPLLEGLNHGR